MKQKIKHIFKKPKLQKKGEPESRLSEAIQGLPRITNETVAEHREEMLSSARKYIYPLQHTKYSVVKISAGLLIVAVVLFFGYIFLALYRLQSASTFVYGVTQVLPLPVARAGTSWVAYENYLFELRHYMHYYETQQQIDFRSESGKAQLNVFKKQAMREVVDAAYVKQLAKKQHLSVSDQEVDDTVKLLRDQNRLGSSDREFADVLKEFWGWSIDDFKRELKQQLLAQKLVSSLDTTTNQTAQRALNELQAGAKFEDVARNYSSDTATKNSGGEYTFLIDQSNRDLAPQVVAELLKLQPNQISGIINTGYTLEIVKVLSVDNGKVRAAHIRFNYQDLDTLLKPQQQKQKLHQYITLH